MKHRLPSGMMTAYHSSYRTLIFSNLKDRPRVMFEDGKILGERDLAWSNNLYFIWILAEFTRYANELGAPWIIVNGDTTLFQKITFTEEETKLIQKKGLHVFMYEPLFILNQDRTWPWLPGNGVPIFSDLDEITKLRMRLKGSPRICVHLCEKGMSEYLRRNDLFPELQFEDFSTLLMHEVRLNSLPAWTIADFSEINRNLLSLNFRYEPSREMLVGFLRGHNLHRKCHLSFFHSHDPKTFHERLPFDPSQSVHWPIIEQGITAMQKEIPYSVDTREIQIMKPVEGSLPDLGGNNLRDFNRAKYFMSKSFAFAYCESRPFSPCSEVSEKTVHPILSMRPFLAFAAPGFLKSLRELGFHTFSEFWDESFDEMEDPQKRFTGFLDSVRFVASQDLEELKNWGRRLMPILEHNRLHMMQNLVKNETDRLRRKHRRSLPWRLGRPW